MSSSIQKKSLKKRIIEKKQSEDTKKIEKRLLKKVKKEEKPKEIVFSPPQRKSIDHSKYVYWCNPHTSINIGKLGSSQAWRIEKPAKSYY